MEFMAANWAWFLVGGLLGIPIALLIGVAMAAFLTWKDCPEKEATALTFLTAGFFLIIAKVTIFIGVIGLLIRILMRFNI